MVQELSSSEPVLYDPVEAELLVAAALALALVDVAVEEDPEPVAEAEAEDPVVEPVLDELPLTVELEPPEYRAGPGMS